MYLTLGVAAHVDAGKTTLCEQMLARAGVIRRCGRVDHGDAFMDGDPLERARGITIFCEQASLELRDADGTPLCVTLMDTPGHVDFSGEMERALSVLDAALLVVSCAEGVQSHTVTLFRMLRARKIPTLIFLNKTDREGADAPRVLAQMRRLLSGDCVRMAGDASALREELAARDGALLERHFEEAASRADYLAGARRAFAACGLYPVLAGSALNGEGVDALMQAVAALCRTDWETRAAEPFAAQGLPRAARRRRALRLYPGDGGHAARAGRGGDDAGRAEGERAVRRAGREALAPCAACAGADSGRRGAVRAPRRAHRRGLRRERAGAGAADERACAAQGAA